tara:strand:+ start:59 stop:859 length:801 start_codon:yes stop_codon:yes gene_type:complete
MKKIRLNDGTAIYCIKRNEAFVLQQHIYGYLKNCSEFKESDTIIDVGANIGLLGLTLSKKYKNIKIHAFEPMPDIFSVLKKNVQVSTNSNYKVYPIGISNKNKDLVFTYYPNSPALSTSNPEIWNSNKLKFFSAVKGNLLNFRKKKWWINLIPFFLVPLIAKFLTFNSIEIKRPVIRLGDFIKENNISNIKLLKIDCEGEEVNVLKGLNEENFKNIDQIIMEVFDINNNINVAIEILKKNKFKQIKIEEEKGFEESNLVNIIASKT